MQSERAALVERVHYAERRAAEAETAAERDRGELAERASLLQSQLEAMRPQLAPGSSPDGIGACAIDLLRAVGVKPDPVRGVSPSRPLSLARNRPPRGGNRDSASTPIFAALQWSRHSRRHT